MMRIPLPLLLLLLLGAGAAPGARAEFRAAIAVRIITPDPLLPVSGGVGPSHPTTRKSGDLTGRALVLASGDTRVAIVSVDALGFPSVLGDRVRKEVPQIPGTNILIAATHTHSAPDFYGFPGSSVNLKYLESVCHQLASAIQEANSRLQPVGVRIATGPARGKIAYNAYAEELYDPRCHVLQFSTPAGAPVITLVNYAIHPEVLGSDQGILSPDLIGPLYERLSAKGGGTGIFLNSAQGGMVTADCRTEHGAEARTWDECVRIGNLLADEALRIVGGSAVQPDPELICRSRTVSFPVESPSLLAVMRSSPLGLGQAGEAAVSTQLNLINLGSAQMLTIPGEALPNIGFYLKRKMRGAHNLLFGLTNDAFGYILTKEDWGSFKRYDYISRISLGEQTGEILVRNCLQLVQESPPPKGGPQPPK